MFYVRAPVDFGAMGHRAFTIAQIARVLSASTWYLHAFVKFFRQVCRAVEANCALPALAWEV